MDKPFETIHSIILETNPTKKCVATLELYKQFDDLNLTAYQGSTVADIPMPGYPQDLTLVAPRKLKKRGIQSQQGRNILMHSIAHIEYNAINLALDAAYRFRGQAQQFYQDWLKVASDEARHFTLVNQYLNDHGSYYGEFPAHDGLWSMTVKTAHDIIARMALVPRVLEARGLDVTPGIIQKLKRANDAHAVDILEVIYNDEIEHVGIGSYWFKYHCQQQKLDPYTTFKKMIELYFIGDIKGPFNISARLLAGFEQEEINDFELMNAY